MKKAILIMTALCIWIFVIWFEFYNLNSIPNTSQKVEISGLNEITDKGLPLEEIDPVIERINHDNNKIKTLICNNLKLKISQKGKAYRARGYFYYEKERNFRMVLKSIRGIEFDMGSNDTHFWFWSRSMSPQALYYARHGHLEETRLREPFNPIWIMHSLGIENIPLDSKLVKIDNKIYVPENVKSAQGKELIRTIVIDKDKKNISSYYLFNKNNQFVTITHITRDDYGLPNKIYTSWAEEDVSMEFTVDKPKINVIPDREVFSMPVYSRTIDMENY